MFAFDIVALVERAGLSLQEANVMWYMQTAWWGYRIQTIPFVTELPSAARTQFEIDIRVSYGRPSVAGLYYEFVKRHAHPDAVRYIDNVLAQPG